MAKRERDLLLKRNNRVIESFFREREGTALSWRLNRTNPGSNIPDTDRPLSGPGTALEMACQLVCIGGGWIMRAEVARKAGGAAYLLITSHHPKTPDLITDRTEIHGEAHV